MKREKLKAPKWAQISLRNPKPLWVKTKKEIRVKMGKNVGKEKSGFPPRGFSGKGKRVHTSKIFPGENISAIPQKKV